MRVLMLLLATAALPLPAWSQSINNLQGLSQEEFRLLSEDMASAYSYRPMAPAASLGVFGFDVGLGATVAKLKYPEIFERATTDDAGDTISVPTLRARVGLPLNLDVGLSYASVPSTEITLYGAEVKWAFIPGDTVWPAIAVRGSMTRMSDVDQMTVETRGIDLSISKGFAFVTPYGGIGRVYGKGDPKGIAGLTEESFHLDKVFLGVSLKFLLFNFTLEGDKTGDVSAYSAKLSLQF